MKDLHIQRIPQGKVPSPVKKPKTPQSKTTKKTGDIAADQLSFTRGTSPVTQANMPYSSQDLKTFNSIRNEVVGNIRDSINLNKHLGLIQKTEYLANLLQGIHGNKTLTLIGDNLISNAPKSTAVLGKHMIRDTQKLDKEALNKFFDTYATILEEVSSITDKSLRHDLQEHLTNNIQSILQEPRIQEAAEKNSEVREKLQTMLENALFSQFQCEPEPLPQYFKNIDDSLRENPTIQNILHNALQPKRFEDKYQTIFQISPETKEAHRKIELYVEAENALKQISPSSEKPPLYTRKKAGILASLILRSKRHKEDLEDATRYLSQFETTVGKIDDAFGKDSDEKIAQKKQLFETLVPVSSLSWFKSSLRRNTDLKEKALQTITTMLGELTPENTGTWIRAIDSLGISSILGQVLIEKVQSQPKNQLNEEAGKILQKLNTAIVNKQPDILLALKPYLDLLVKNKGTLNPDNKQALNDCVANYKTAFSSIIAPHLCPKLSDIKASIERRVTEGDVDGIYEAQEDLDVLFSLPHDQRVDTEITTLKEHLSTIRTETAEQYIEICSSPIKETYKQESIKELRRLLTHMTEHERFSLCENLKEKGEDKEQLLLLFKQENINRSLRMAIYPDELLKELQRENDPDERDKLEAIAQNAHLSLSSYVNRMDVLKTLKEIATSTQGEKKLAVSSFLEEFVHVNFYVPSASDEDSQAFKKLALEIEATLDIDTSFFHESIENLCVPPTPREPSVSTSDAIKHLENAIEKENQEEAIQEISTDLFELSASTFCDLNFAELFTAKDPTSTFSSAAEIFNKTTWYVKNSISQKLTNSSGLSFLQDRSTFWLGVAEHCYRQGDIASAFAISLALNSTEISRLNTEDSLYLDRLQILEKNLSPFDNFSSMRRHMEELKDKPVISPVSVSQRDYVTNKEKHFEQGSLPRILHTSSLTVDEINAQQNACENALTKIHITTNIAQQIRSTTKDPSNSLYQLSREIKPRGS